jgi:hypothetical protein
MDWILVINSEDLGYPRGTPELLQRTLRCLRKRTALLKALQFAAALGTDVANQYRTVDGLLAAAAPEELRNRIARLRRDHPGKHFVFFEPWQQLLLARHLCRFGSEAHDALDTETQEGRDLFFQACLIINDLSMPPAPPLQGDPITDALIVAAHAIPRLWLLNPPNMNDSQARLLAFLEVVPRDHPELSDQATTLRNRFTEDLGVSFDDVLDLTSFLGYWSMSHNAEDILRDLNVALVAPDTWLQQIELPRETFESLVTRISQPADGLTPDAPPRAGSAWFDPLGFRDRPLVRLHDGNFLVTMPELLMEKAGFDMLWWLTGGPGGGPQVRAWQAAFGRLCETYILDILRHIDEGAVFPNVAWEQGEIDALVWREDRLAVVEICSGFMANAPKMSGDHAQLRRELCRRYVEHPNSDGDIDREAIAQIARDVDWLLSRRRSGGHPPIPLGEIQTIHPVIITADRAARTHGVWRLLDQELRRRLPGRQPWQVAPVAVLGLEDLEWIEQAAHDRHDRLTGTLPPVLQTLRWWEFDATRRYPAFWQLLQDAFGEPKPNARLRELFERRTAQMRARFSSDSTTGGRN